MTSKSTFKEATIKKLAEILNETGLTEIEYEIEGSRIRVARQPAPSASTMVMPASVPQASARHPAPDASAPALVEDNWEKHPGVVKSPMVGTVYHAPSPDADPFVKVGDPVSEGQTLMIIEAMKVMNPLKAKKSGVVKKIFVENAHPVEYDQPLIVIA